MGRKARILDRSQGRGGTEDQSHNPRIRVVQINGGAIPRMIRNVPRMSPGRTQAHGTGFQAHRSQGTQG
jgi:hypothetical protein